MTDTKPINHEEALQYARMHEHDSNLARCYLELAAIKSQPVPVEPDEVTTLIDGSWSELNAAATRKHIDTLQTALQRVREERDDAGRMVKNLAPTGRYNGLDIERWMQRAEKAEAALKLAQQECIEQARVNGAGASREAALMAKLAALAREMEGAHQICELCNQHYDQHAYDRLFDSRFICPDRKGVFRSKRHTKTVEPVATVYDAYDTTGIDWHCRHPPAAGAKLYDQTAIDSLQTALQRVREERDKCAQMNDDQSRRVFAAEERVKRMVELMKEPSASMIAAGYPPNDERSQSWDVTEVFKAMSAQLLKEAGE